LTFQTISVGRLPEKQTISGGYSMPRWFNPKDKTQNPPSFSQLSRPIKNFFPSMPPLEARGNKKLELDFEQQLNALILFHLDEHVSGSHLLHILEEDTLARQIVGTPAGIAKSTFFEAINTRGLEQLSYLFGELYKSAASLAQRPCSSRSACWNRRLFNQRDSFDVLGRLPKKR
jgi:hypothetical protein